MPQIAKPTKQIMPINKEFSSLNKSIIGFFWVSPMYSNILLKFNTVVLTKSCD